MPVLLEGGHKATPHLPSHAAHGLVVDAFVAGPRQFSPHSERQPKCRSLSQGPPQGHPHSSITQASDPAIGQSPPSHLYSASLHHCLHPTVISLLGASTPRVLRMGYGTPNEGVTKARKGCYAAQFLESWTFPRLRWLAFTPGLRLGMSDPESASVHPHVLSLLGSPTTRVLRMEFRTPKEDVAKVRGLLRCQIFASLDSVQGEKSLAQGKTKPTKVLEIESDIDDPVKLEGTEQVVAQVIEPKHTRLELVVYKELKEAPLEPISC
ncbi:hypothetical protein AMTR_s00055p00067940 [Amborella trichopoda]|uniref:Uncharacterized protein n=1 Tax=Amborella trichopoda TaxID=13333 RepID=U5D7M0_AMBTC|nr:hypothetical protein AMTR_s00055p00067940 [Amborella trichopoda]